jgi:hypothetical protein
MGYADNIHDAFAIINRVHNSIVTNSNPVAF